MSTAKKPSENILKLQKLMESMGDDERETLERSGVVLPNGDLAAVAEKRYKFALRCTHCNQIALYFIGETWDVEGQATDYPPPVPHYRVLWTQEGVPVHEINRNAPFCQNCRVPVPLNPDDSFRRDRKRIILVEDWMQTRDKAFAEGRKVAQNAERNSGAQAAEMSQHYNSPNEKASKAIERLGLVGSAAEIERVAELTGAKDALARGFKEE